MATSYPNDGFLQGPVVPRGGTAADLAIVNPTPLSREIIVESDTGKAKVGNGSSPYTSLPYLGAGTPGGGATLIYGTLQSKDYGIVSDGVDVPDVVGNSGTKILTSASGSFSPAMQGKRISVPGGMAGGRGALLSTVDSVQNTGQITLVDTLGASVSPAIGAGVNADVANGHAVVGTDDIAQWPVFLAACQAQGRVGRLAPGRSVTTGQIIPLSGVTLEGFGGKDLRSGIMPIGNTLMSGIRYNGQAAGGVGFELLNAGFYDFFIDCIGVAMDDVNGAGVKAMFIQYAIDLHASRLYLRNSVASLFGCDFLPRHDLTDIWFERSGRQALQQNLSGGLSGLGIGTGAYLDESGIFSDLSFKNCYRDMLLENQFGPSGVTGLNGSQGIRINNARSVGGVFGYLDHGNDGAELDGYYVSGKADAVIDTTNGFPGSSGRSRNSIVKNVQARNCSGKLASLNSGDGTHQFTNITAIDCGTFQINPPSNTATDATVPRRLVFDNFRTTRSIGRGLQVATGASIPRIDVVNSSIEDTSGVGVDISGTVGTLYLDADLTDSRSGSARTQAYPLRINSGATISTLVYGPRYSATNHLTSNAPLNNGTIGTTVTK